MEGIYNKVWATYYMVSVHVRLALANGASTNCLMTQWQAVHWDAWAVATWPGRRAR